MPVPSSTSGSRATRRSSSPPPTTTCAIRTRRSPSCSGRGAGAVLRSFWSPPGGFERRWATPIDPGTVLRRIIERGWPVTPELGALLELTVACAELADAGEVVPGVVAPATSGWIAAPARPRAAAWQTALDDAHRFHGDVERFATPARRRVRHHHARPGPRPPPRTRVPTPTFTHWTDRVRARRAAGARLILRLDTDRAAGGAGATSSSCRACRAGARRASSRRSTAATRPASTSPRPRARGRTDA